MGKVLFYNLPQRLDDPFSSVGSAWYTILWEIMCTLAIAPASLALLSIRWKVRTPLNHAFKTKWKAWDRLTRRGQIFCTSITSLRPVKTMIGRFSYPQPCLDW